jgi:hypothetical protein
MDEAETEKLRRQQSFARTRAEKRVPAAAAKSGLRREKPAGGKNKITSRKR